MHMTSLSSRLLLWVSVLLVLFFGLTVAALDLVFRTVGEDAMRDRLDIHLIALLAAAEPEEFGELYMPADLPEARFSNPGSGLYGQIHDAEGTRIWRSKSSVGTDIAFPEKLRPGSKVVSIETLQSGSEVMALSMGVEWEFENGEVMRYVFSVAESMTPYYEQVAKFRHQLLGWFGALMVLLLLALAVLLRRVLRPLRRIESEIGEIEAGVRAELGAGYPKELQGVTRNANTLLRTERGRQERYRHILDNLAHSLKTPLAVMRNLVESNASSTTDLEHQISRMDEIVRYQLKKATATGSSGLGAAPVPVEQAARDLLHTLDKVYAEKRVECSHSIDGNAVFFGDHGDLMELLGNLLDNAYKWCKRKVRLSVSVLPSQASRRHGLQIIVEEDGPGIDDDDVDIVVNRGTRADERVEGQGIGLAVVKELVTLYRGELEITRSDLGGREGHGHDAVNVGESVDRATPRSLSVPHPAPR